MHTLRLHCTGRTAVGLKPVTGTCPAACWDADDLEIAVWIDAGTRSLLGRPEPFDVTLIDTLRLECRETPETDAQLFTAKELTSFTACTFADFKDDEGEHAYFTLSSTDTNFALTLEKVWISIVAELSNGKRYTCTAGYMAIVRSGDSTSQGPVTADSITFATGIATISSGGNTHRWPVESTATADPDSDSITISAGIASYTKDGYTHRWPVETA